MDITDQKDTTGAPDVTDFSEIGNMTALSKEMLSSACDTDLQLSDAIKLLREEAEIRRVRDTLAFFAGIPVEQTETLKTHLIDSLCACVPGMPRDSIRRKVQIWMKDDALTVSKQSAIQIAFALKLNLSQSDLLLKRLCGEGIHWRDPEDIVFFGTLMLQESYEDAQKLYAEIVEKTGSPKNRREDPTVYTDQIRSRIAGITSLDELRAFVLHSYSSLGKMHNTAYGVFMDFMKLLMDPEMDYEAVFKKETSRDYSEKSLVEIKKYASREIMETYLYRPFVPVAKRNSESNPTFSALQRSIRQNWPDEVALSKMMNRETDVTRKVLILLFLAADGGINEYSDAAYDASTKVSTPEDLFRDTYARLNLMLADCGFAPLDPRSQFDWMVLYCMCVDDNIFIDGKIQRFLAEIFPSVQTQPDKIDSEGAWDLQRQKLEQQPPEG